MLVNREELKYKIGILILKGWAFGILWGLAIGWLIWVGEAQAWEPHPDTYYPVVPSPGDEIYNLTWNYSFVRTDPAQTPYTLDEIRNTHVYIRFWNSDTGHDERWKLYIDVDQLTGEWTFNAISSDVWVPIDMKDNDGLCFAVVTGLRANVDVPYTDNHSTWPYDLPPDKTPCALAACHPGAADAGLVE